VASAAVAAGDCRTRPRLRRVTPPVRVVQNEIPAIRPHSGFFVFTTGGVAAHVGELVAIDTDHLRDDNSVLSLPAHIQKEYPTENSPSAARLGLATDTTRTLTSYLSRRWKDTTALFPSRSSERLTTEAVRNMFQRVAAEVGVKPFHRDGSRGSPSDVTPHALRHSVAYRMMNTEDGNTLSDVQNRLRHRSIQTTERVSDHIIEVCVSFSLTRSHRSSVSFVPRPPVHSPRTIFRGGTPWFRLQVGSNRRMHSLHEDQQGLGSENTERSYLVSYKPIREVTMRISLLAPLDHIHSQYIPVARREGSLSAV
jgi:integrase/recombinase XerD